MKNGYFAKLMIFAFHEHLQPFRVLEGPIDGFSRDYRPRIAWIEENVLVV